MASVGRKYDLYSETFFAGAYATFAQMRDNDPVLWQAGIDGKTPLWFVTRYEDAETVLLDDERFVRDVRLALSPEELAVFEAEMPAGIEYVDSHMLNRDGDDHKRLRRLVSKAFTPRMIEQLRPRIQEIADDLLDPVVPAGEMDLVSTFAFPLPITVIAELLGVPVDHRDQFREWSNAFVSPALDPDSQALFMQSMAEFVAYLHALFETRRAEPRDDLVSALVAVEDGGDTLSETELTSMASLLIVAGHETTVSLIGNAVVALLANPEQLALIENDPSLLPRAVEELIRFDGPVERTLNRWAAEDVELGGQTIRRGDSLIVILGAADHDPERFEAADALDVTAERSARHLGFGRGSHFCLGAPLARLEAEIALETLLRRLPGLRLAVPPDELRWRPVPLFRSLVAVPVAWET
jgi:cytochrome P450